MMIMSDARTRMHEQAASRQARQGHVHQSCDACDQYDEVPSTRDHHKILCLSYTAFITACLPTTADDCNTFILHLA